MIVWLYFYEAILTLLSHLKISVSFCSAIGDNKVTDPLPPRDLAARGEWVATHSPRSVCAELGGRGGGAIAARYLGG